MKEILGGLAFALAATCMTSSMAMAATSCTDLSIINHDVTSFGSCSIGGLTFSNFSVNGVPNPPGTTVFLSSIGTHAGPGGEVDLGFQLATPWNGTTVTAADTVLQYIVNGPANIVGVNNLQSGGLGVTIQEIVCSVAFVSGNCAAANQLANFTNPPTTTGNFAAQSTIYILKDIAQNGPNASISSFVNSVETSTVPEPATLSMMGLGLLGFGLIGRLRKS
jgi:PEP-CTERM motif